MRSISAGWSRLLLACTLGVVGVCAWTGLSEEAAGMGVPLAWLLARVSGLVAYVGLWLSMVFGVFVSGRGAGGLLRTSVMLDLHRGWTVAALVATGAHVVWVVADGHSGVGLVGGLVPFASNVQRGAVGIGVIAMWALVAVALSSAFRRRLNRTVWRAIHATAFGAFLLALVHSVVAGSDSGSPLMQRAYALSLVVLLGAVLQRVLLAWWAGERSRAS